MTPQERELIADLFDRLAHLENEPRDADAERAIRDGLRRAPHAAYPLVPRSEVGFRVQVTASNTDAEIDQLIDVLGRLVNVFDLQPARTSERAA